MGFVAKDRLTYDKELDQGPDSLPVRYEEQLHTTEEHRKDILKFYREDCELDANQMTLFLRTYLDKNNPQTLG